MQFFLENTSKNMHNLIMLERKAFNFLENWKKTKQNERRTSSRKLSPRSVQGHEQRRYVPQPLYGKDTRHHRVRRRNLPIG